MNESSSNLSDAGTNEDEMNRRSSFSGASYLRAGLGSSVGHRRASVGPSSFLPDNNKPPARDPLAIARERAKKLAAAEAEKKSTVADDGVPMWKKKLLEKKKKEAVAVAAEPKIDPCLPAWKQKLLEKKRKEDWDSSGHLTLDDQSQLDANDDETQNEEENDEPENTTPEDHAASALKHSDIVSKQEKPESHASPAEREIPENHSIEINHSIGINHSIEISTDSSYDEMQEEKPEKEVANAASKEDAENSEKDVIIASRKEDADPRKEKPFVAEVSAKMKEHLRESSAVSAKATKTTDSSDDDSVSSSSSNSSSSLSDSEDVKKPGTKDGETKDRSSVSLDLASLEKAIHVPDKAVVVAGQLPSSNINRSNAGGKETSRPLPAYSVKKRNTNDDSSSASSSSSSTSSSSSSSSSNSEQEKVETKGKATPRPKQGDDDHDSTSDHEAAPADPALKYIKESSTNKQNDYSESEYEEQSVTEEEEDQSAIIDEKVRESAVGVEGGEESSSSDETTFSESQHQSFSRSQRQSAFGDNEEETLVSESLQQSIPAVLETNSSEAVADDDRVEKLVPACKEKPEKDEVSSGKQGVNPSAKEEQTPKLAGDGFAKKLKKAESDKNITGQGTAESQKNLAGHRNVLHRDADLTRMPSEHSVKVVKGGSLTASSCPDTALPAQASVLPAQASMPVSHTHSTRSNPHPPPQTQTSPIKSHRSKVLNTATTPAQSLDSVQPKRGSPVKKRQSLLGSVPPSPLGGKEKRRSSISEGVPLGPSLTGKKKLPSAPKIERSVLGEAPPSSSLERTKKVSAVSSVVGNVKETRMNAVGGTIPVSPPGKIRKNVTVAPEEKVTGKKKDISASPTHLESVKNDPQTVFRKGGTTATHKKPEVGAKKPSVKKLMKATPDAKLSNAPKSTPDPDSSRRKSSKEVSSSTTDNNAETSKSTVKKSATKKDTDITKLAKQKSSRSQSTKTTEGNNTTSKAENPPRNPHPGMSSSRNTPSMKRINGAGSAQPPSTQPPSTKNPNGPAARRSVSPRKRTMEEPPTSTDPMAKPVKRSSSPTKKPVSREPAANPPNVKESSSKLEAPPPNPTQKTKSGIGRLFHRPSTKTT